jgi:N-acylneuraminate cytidylyltransferase
MFKILCIIPARSGSKGILNKNIKEFKGKPLIAWSIEQVKKSKYYQQMKIIISTDSNEYAKIANHYGAEVPFLRPKEISEDLSTDFEFINYTVSMLKKTISYIPDIILHIRPTSPLRKVETIDECLELFIKNIENYDSLRSVVPFQKSPYKMYNIDDNVLKPLFLEINNIKEPYNQCRQVLPKCYLHNGYIDIMKTCLIEKGSISGNKIYPYVMKETDTIDIDNESEWENAENLK